MSTRATPCVGYWAAYYINRDGGWSVACDALGRIIRCETEKLALIGRALSPSSSPAVSSGKPQPSAH